MSSTEHTFIEKEFTETDLLVRWPPSHELRKKEPCSGMLALAEK
jgi:hypothetical protein